MDDLNPAPVASPHVTRPNEVWITEPVSLATRPRVARWLEDRGHAVSVPGGLAHHQMLVVETSHGVRAVDVGERIVVAGRDVDVIDHAHYKLWYEPVADATLIEPDID